MPNAKEIKTVFTGIILIAVLGFAGNMIIGMADNPLDAGTLTLADENEMIDNLDVGSYTDVASATVTTEYVAGVDNLVVKLNGNTVLDETGLSSSGSFENNVASMITEQNNELQVTADNTGSVSGLKSTLDVSVKRDTLTVISKLSKYGPYIVMVLVMTLFVSGIVVLLRYLNVL